MLHLKDYYVANKIIDNLKCYEKYHIMLSSCCCEVTSVVSDSVQPHRQQPTRLPCPWDSPGKNTGVGCHCLLRFYCPIKWQKQNKICIDNHSCFKCAELKIMHKNRLEVCLHVNSWWSRNDGMMGNFFIPIFTFRLSLLRFKVYK